MDHDHDGKPCDDRRNTIRLAKALDETLERWLLQQRDPVHLHTMMQGTASFIMAMLRSVSHQHDIPLTELADYYGKELMHMAQDIRLIETLGNN